jgi:UDP-N-acetylmuramoylalanine--D-glutamate ligase
MTRSTPLRVILSNRSMNNNPIAVIDSGVGGLSIWQKITQLLPNESIIYIADSKNNPYGNKSYEEICKNTALMIEFLLKQDVKAIILACNTATVFCLNELRERFPKIPIIGTVPVVKTAAEKTHNGKIGILSTENTANSDYQKKLIDKFAGGYSVVNVGTNKLVPLIENGKIDGEEVNETLKLELKRFQDERVDVIALGCTHYPFLRKNIERIMGNNVLILDSGDAIARQTKRVLEKTENLAPAQNPSYEFYTTGDPDKFSKIASGLVNKNIVADKVVLENVFVGKKIGIIGFGIEGISSAKFLLKKGAKVTILDKKEANEIDEKDLEELKGLDLNYIFGINYLNHLNEFNIVVRSPGVKRGLKELEEFEKNGGLITSQTQIFFDLCPAKVIGVTGTKGKGTTSSLIYEMLRAQGLKVYLGGNIGNPPLDFLDRLTSDSYAVLELSSFQLIDLKKSPHVAVMLMTTSEHLDYHRDANEYIDAKRNILRFQKSSDFSVVNRDYIPSNESDIFTQGKVYKISKERETKNGCYVKDKKLTVNTNGASEEVIKTDEILLPGSHNLENVCAAVIVAKILKVQTKNIVKVLKEFKGLEHRLELIREINGVKYYDDSFSTTPETAIAGIKAFKNPEILILGGSSKNSDFSELGKVISEAKNIKAIIGIGAEWPKIKSKISSIRQAQDKSQTLIIERAKDMYTIIAAANKIAAPGDVVLLSPACASFGMFKNYKDRGEQFKREVSKLT